jgi:hypothetical protein
VGKTGRILFDRQPKGIQSQQHRGIAAEDIQKAAVRQVAFESAAGPGAIVVYFADMLVVAFLEKHTSLVVRVNHVE